MTQRVIVVAGGPDAEHEVSVQSGQTIARALTEGGRFGVELAVVDSIDERTLGGLECDVFFPALHGPFGEGGGFQRLLDTDGRPYVGSGPRASRMAMDKVLSKELAAELGVYTSPTCIIDPAETILPIDLPVVVKPIFEGSTIGLHVCRTEAEWLAAHASASRAAKPAMIEPLIVGRELTVGAIERGRGGGSGGGEFEALPVIEITTADGLYDYEAKYNREDTRYKVDPALPDGVARRIQEQTVALARRIGIHDLCRADFILDDQCDAVFLEINTMPGFTSHSLYPMAAAEAGMDLPSLCEELVENSLRRWDRAHGREKDKDNRGQVQATRRGA